MEIQPRHVDSDNSSTASIAPTISDQVLVIPGGRSIEIVTCDMRKRGSSIYIMTLLDNKNLSSKVLFVRCTV